MLHKLLVQGELARDALQRLNVLLALDAHIGWDLLSRPAAALLQVLRGERLNQAEQAGGQRRDGATNRYRREIGVVQCC